MNYAVATLWHERQRFLPGVLAVAFSAVLIAMQCGLLLGLFAITSLPVDRTQANTPTDVWVGSSKVLSVDLGRPIPREYLSRVASLPGVERVEFYVQAFATWNKRSGGSDLCMIVGSRLEADSLGLLDVLTPDLREKLTEPGSVVIDESDADRLGVKKLGDTGHINRKAVRVVGIVNGVKSLAGPYVLCSESTAHYVLGHILPPDHTIYLLARCESPQRAEEVARLLREHYPDDLAAYTAPDFSLRTRLHWLTKTKAGIALGYAALLGLLVGMIVTSQTLYAATTSQAKEYAILLALGIPRWRIYWAVLVQSFWVGVAGLGVAGPAIVVINTIAAEFDARAHLPPELVLGAAGVTLCMAMIAGLFALRSVRQIQPMNLLR